MRRLFPITLIALACLCLPSLAAAKGQLLYSVTSGDLTITRHSGALHVSVPAKAKLSWFTDRPARRAGTGTAADLAAGWVANGFDKRPPNAALVTTSKGNTMQTIVTLRKPVLKNGRVSFTYRVVSGGKMLGMSTTGRPAAGSYVGELFVDDGTTPPCASGITLSSAALDCVAAPGISYAVSGPQPPAGMSGSAAVTLSACGTNGSATAYVTTTSGTNGDVSTGSAQPTDVLSCAQTAHVTLGSAGTSTTCLNTGKRIPYCITYSSSLQITVSSPMRFIAPS